MPDRIVLSRSQYLYLTAFVLLLLPLILIAAAPGVADNLWCEHVEMEEYEKALGFSYGPVPVPRSGGGTALSHGFRRVEANGPLGRAGIKGGDVPRAYHGVADLCEALSAVRRGETVELEVITSTDSRPRHRLVSIPGLAR